MSFSALPDAALSVWDLAGPHAVDRVVALADFVGAGNVASGVYVCPASRDAGTSMHWSGCACGGSGALAVTAARHLETVW